jgi:hypothetical protein
VFAKHPSIDSVIHFAALKASFAPHSFSVCDATQQAKAEDMKMKKTKKNKKLTGFIRVPGRRRVFRDPS